MLDLFEGVISLQKNSFIDFPGRASALLFFGNCNLRCPFCHNPQLACGKEVPVITAQEIVDFLYKRRKFLEGVVITGGEPTLYNKLPQLTAFLKEELTYEVKVDSNGLNADLLEVTPYDYLALDLKTTFDRYRSLLGASGKVEENLHRSVELVKKAGPSAEIRITCAPGIVDKKVIEELLPVIQGVHNVFLQPFKYSDHLIDSQFFVGQKHIETEDLKEFQEMISPSVEHCRIRGI